MCWQHGSRWRSQRPQYSSSSQKSWTQTYKKIQEKRSSIVISGSKVWPSYVRFIYRPVHGNLSTFVNFLESVLKKTLYRKLLDNYENFSHLILPLDESTIGKVGPLKHQILLKYCRVPKKVMLGLFSSTN